MTYRDEGDAGTLRRDAIVLALRAEPDLERREAIAIELASWDRSRRIEARRRLPVVARAQIASPCHETFETMIGEGAIRTCARCDHEVFDLAQMTLGQAEALIASRVGVRTCMRLSKRSDGTMMFSDCEVGARGVRTRRIGAIVAAAVMVTTAIAWAAAPPARAASSFPSTPRPHGTTVPGARYIGPDPDPAPVPSSQAMGIVSFAPLGPTGS